MALEKGELALAAVSLMLMRAPIEGEWKVVQYKDGYHVEDDTTDFWEDPLAHEFEASIIASLLNLGIVAVLGICEFLDALQEVAPGLYPDTPALNNTGEE